jgi:hypothetical protein
VLLVGGIGLFRRRFGIELGKFVQKGGRGGRVLTGKVLNAVLNLIEFSDEAGLLRNEVSTDVPQR